MRRPQRGDVYELRRAKYVVGHEQSGQRFAVLVQNSMHLSLSTVLVCPTSLSAQPSRLHPEVDIRGRSSLVLVPQLFAADWGRLGRLVGTLTLSELQHIDTVLAVLLDLERL